MRIEQLLEVFQRRSDVARVFNVSNVSVSRWDDVPELRVHQANKIIQALQARMGDEYEILRPFSSNQVKAVIGDDLDNLLKGKI